MEYTVIISEIDDRILRHKHRDPQDWFQKVVDESIKRVRKEVKTLSFNRMMADELITTKPETEDDLLVIELDHPDYLDAEGKYLKINPPAIRKSEPT